MQQQPDHDDDGSGLSTVALDVEMTRVAVTNDETNTMERPAAIPTASNHSTSSLPPLADTAKHAIHRFFYPPEENEDPIHGSNEEGELEDDDEHHQQHHEDGDRAFVHHFWTTYDDILILSIFTQIGIVFRLAASLWFARFDDVFSHSSALFVNLPLNCLSCFVMGVLGSGEQLMEVISATGTRTRGRDTTQNRPLRRPKQQKMHEGSSDEEEPPCMMVEQQHNTTRLGGLRRRLQRPAATKQPQPFHSWQPPVQLHQELREVQLQALERRIRLSKCLVLFPLKKEDVDVMEHYFDRGYQKEPPHSKHQLDDLALREENDDDEEDGIHPQQQTLSIVSSASPVSHSMPTSSDSSLDASDNDDVENSYIADLTTNVQENVTANIHRFNRLQSSSLFRRGWDSGTTANDMSDDLLLGLRDGFCGALSSFSSWNSSMIALLRQAEFSKAIVGYMLGIQLPIISYRFGQHVAIYLFVWRTRRETRIAERRGGYGIRIAQHEEETPRRIPSLRAVFTALFIIAVVAQCTSIYFFSNLEDQQIALSLLFSPLGVLARWRLSQWNTNSFPRGTLTANLLACALSGSLGSLLAGNPGPKERIVLQSIVAGFGGTLSSLATFIVEILAGIDPILFRFDGVLYAIVSVVGALVIGFGLSASVEWADETVFVNATTTTVNATIAAVLDDDGSFLTDNVTRLLL